TQRRKSGTQMTQVTRICADQKIQSMPMGTWAWHPILMIVLVFASTAMGTERVRVIVETDAGGDPDDEQSMVRFLLYANDFDVEGIIANRPKARDAENKNSERTGLGIVRRMVRAYGKCYSNLSLNDRRYPSEEYLLKR